MRWKLSGTRNVLKLYDLVGKDDRRFSPTCWRIKLALAHKGLPFETVPTAFTAIRTIGDGIKTLPVIEHEGRLIDDSSRIADHLERAYPDRAPLFGCDAAQALTGFVDAWVLATLHAQLFPLIVHDIYEHCLEVDQPYFRESREERLRQPLAEVQAGRDERIGAFRGSLLPLRAMLNRQPFIGGERAIYADYMVLGAFQWVRSVSAFQVLGEDDPIRDYLCRLMGLHEGIGAKAVAYPL